MGLNTARSISQWKFWKMSKTAIISRLLYYQYWNQKFLLKTKVPLVLYSLLPKIHQYYISPQRFRSFIWFITTSQVNVSLFPLSACNFLFSAKLLSATGVLLSLLCSVGYLRLWCYSYQPNTGIRIILNLYFGILSWFLCFYINWRNNCTWACHNSSIIDHRQNQLTTLEKIWWQKLQYVL